jgi:hypothetical protein
VVDYLEFIAWVTSHIPDKGQVMVRSFGLSVNAHRGKVKKASLSPTASIYTHGLFQVRGRMKVVAFLTAPRALAFPELPARHPVS